MYFPGYTYLDKLSYLREPSVLSLAPHGHKVTKLVIVDDVVALVAKVTNE